MSIVRLAIWAAGGALCAAMVLGAANHGWPPTTKAAIAYMAAFVAITIGLLVWRRRPDSRTGVLLTALPFAGLLADLVNVYPRSALAVTIGLATTWLAAPFYAHVALSYPTGRLTSRIERSYVGLFYLYAAAYAVPVLLFYDPRSPRYQDILEWPRFALPYTHVAWRNVNGITHDFETAALVLALIGIALLIRKLLRATPSGRRVVLPLAVATTFVVVQFAVQMAVNGSPVNSWTSTGWFWTVTAAELAVPVALAAGLLWGRTARSAAADLVVELEQAPPGSIRDALARALGDPSLELALWLPDRRSYVDRQGRPFALPAADGGRAVTLLGAVEAPVAALVHDPALLERRALLEAAGAAARLALENERLQAELRAQLAELHASRARIVTAGDEERRRLERDLHDGAQQRLLSLGLALQLVRAQLGPDSNGTTELLAEADAELRAALDELRELARGIHPAVLTEHGLGPALTTLAERSAVPVTITEMPDERMPASTEATIYFLVSEALANVTKYAQASRVQVSVVRRNGEVRVDVADDGVGGANPLQGTGLRGLADRVHAIDGEFEVRSPLGAGTRVRAEIPLE